MIHVGHTSQNGGAGRKGPPGALSMFRLAVCVRELGRVLEKYLTVKNQDKTRVGYSCLGGPHDEILQKPGRPLRCPYLPTYLPTLLMGN